MTRANIYENNKKYLDGKRHFYNIIYVSMEDDEDAKATPGGVYHYGVLSAEEFGMSACYEGDTIKLVRVLDRMPTLKEIIEMPIDEAIDAMADIPSLEELVGKLF